MEHETLCQLVDEIPPGAARRRWTLRADNESHHHSIISLPEGPFYLDLNWRPSTTDPVEPIGLYRLDLEGLLQHGYVRPEPADSQGPDVRLRIVRTPNGHFYVQTRQDAPRLELPRRAAQPPTS